MAATAFEMLKTQSSRKLFADPEYACVTFIKQNFKRYENLLEDTQSLEAGFPVQICELLETNAYGKIRFHPATLGYRKPAHYVRLADTPDAAKSALELMTQYWHLTEPKEPGLVVSVLGGGKLSCLSDSQTREIFNRGLARAIRATNGWLLTYGLNSGVSKAVGAAVEEGRSFEWNEIGKTDRSLQCIGVVPWNQIKNRQRLIAEENSRVSSLQTVEYYVDPCVRLDEPVSLNPNHSHFLMVEDGSQSVDMETGGAPLFRSELEKLIAMPQNVGGLDVPVVCLMVEGGLGSMTQLLRSVEQGLPAVILQNSGRSADLIAEALRRASFMLSTIDTMEQYEQEDRLRPILQDIIDKFADDNDYSDSYRQDLADTLVKLCTSTYRDQISVFKIGGASSLNLDEVLLLRVLESVKDQDPWKQLKLAQQWKRPDVARTIMNNPRFSFNDDKKSQEKLMKRFTECLIKNQYDFVELFVDFGVPICDYLSADRLCSLYLQAFTTAPHVWARLFSFKQQTSVPIDTIRRKQTSPRKTVTLCSINNLFRSFGRRFSHPEYSEDNNGGFSHPYQELFYWAIILNRQQLAELFWQKCEEPLTMAIVGTVLCSWLAGISQGNLNAARQRSYASFKDRLEWFAVKLVNQAFKTNKKKAMLLIHRKSKVWANLDCMSLAALAKDQRFLSTECCQFSISRTWKHGYTATKWRMFLSMVTVILPPWLINFRSNLPRLCRCPPGRCTCRRARPVSTLPQLAFLRATLLRVGQINDEDSEDDEINQPSPNQDNYDYTMSKSVGSLDADKGFMSRLKLDGPMLHSMPSELQEIKPKLARDQQKKMTLRVWAKRMFIFYYSPAIKFVSHTMWYIVYLLLYAFVLLYALDPPAEKALITSNLHWTEYLLYFWQLTFILEELRIILWYPGDKFKDKIYDWWHFSSLATWNHFDLLTLFSSIIIFILRWIPHLFPFVRLLLVLNLIAYIMRIFKVYFINDYLGPKVVMIKRMSKDLLMFFLVLIVFLASYSVGYQALYYGSRKFVFDELGSSFKYGLWEIFGEFTQENIIAGKLESANCNTTLVDFSIGSLHVSISDCKLRTVPVQILLATYLFFVNILLVNMLIATFSHVFEEIQANSELVWKFEMYFLLEEFRSKPLLPPPFIILEHAFLVIRLLTKWKSRKIRVKSSTALADEELIWGQRLNHEELHFLGVFECVCRADFIENESKNQNVNCCCTCCCGLAERGKPETLSVDGIPNQQMAAQHRTDQNNVNFTMMRRKRFAGLKK